MSSPHSTHTIARTVFDSTTDSIKVLVSGVTDLVVDVDASAVSGGSYGNQNVTDTATQIVAADTTRKKGVLVHNASASVIAFIGLDNSVTTTNGMKMGRGVSLFMETTGAVFGITTSGSADIRYIAI